MKYVFGVVIPMLIQSLLVYITIELNTGNGSFVGLGAYLLGITAIPLTAVVNGIYVYYQPTLSPVKITIRCILVALITPILIVLMNVIG